MNNTARALRQNRQSVLLALVAALALSWPHLRKEWDDRMVERPWVWAEIEVVAQAEGPPLIRYHVQAREPFSGVWKAWTQTEDGVRLEGGAGTGNYGLDVGKPRLWSWAAFFERDVPVPAEPFRVCVRYTGALTSGATGRFGPFCSGLHDPVAGGEIN